MPLKQRDLRKESVSSPPLAPLAGGALAKRDRVMSAFANPDRLLADTRRVIGRVGMHCSERMQVTSVNPSSATQVYPTETAQRVALRARFKPTPGCFLMLSALVLPSGSTQVFDPETSWTSAGAGGELRVLVSFVGASTSNVTFTRTLPVSSQTFAGEKQTAGAAWSSLRRVEIPLIYPKDVPNNATDLRDFSECTFAEVALFYKGGVRCVDAVIQEVPLGYARNVGVDAATTFSSPLSVDGSGQIVKSYPLEVVVDEKAASDPSYGTELLADVVHRQQTTLGPILAQWSAWDESTQGLASTEADAVTTASTTFASLISTSTATAWSASNAGWSLSSGGQAQNWKSSSRGRTTRDKNAVVPVRVWAYCSRTSTGDATIRVQSAGYSVAEITVSSGTDGWRSATGYLKCGLGAEDASVLNVFGKTASISSTLSVRHIVVEYLDAG